MRIATTADQLEVYLREVGYGLLDVGTVQTDVEDGDDAAGALRGALHQRLVERGVL